MTDTAVPNANNESQGQPPLDDLMLAMDVVDTLRHDERLVVRELAEDEREAALIERLRQVYSSQGLQVTDRILKDGVAALKEDRFTYTPPKPSLQLTLAKAYVNRGKLGLALSAVAGVLIVGFIAFYFLVTAPANQARQELTQLLPEQLASYQAELNAGELPEQAVPMIADLDSAIGAENITQARAAVARLDRLKGLLDTRYQLQIVTRPDTPSGVWRIPPTNPNGQNFYLIVEAIGPDGAPIPQEILSEETNETKTVSTFGVRVSEHVYEAVGQDKSDDGIIQNNVLGEKPRGTLAIDWSMPVEPGRIFEW